jgi:hypothetical protein
MELTILSVFPVRRLESPHRSLHGALDIGTTGVGVATDPFARRWIEAIGVFVRIDQVTVNRIHRDARTEAVARSLATEGF